MFVVPDVGGGGKSPQPPHLLLINFKSSLSQSTLELTNNRVSLSCENYDKKKYSRN